MIQKSIAFLAKLIGKFLLSDHDQNVLQWKINNLEKLRYECDLDNKSIVFDLGGYEGEWSGEIYSRYQPNIYIFEPVEEFARGIKFRFRCNRKIRIYNFGLSNKTDNVFLFLEKNKSSEFKKGINKVKINLMNVKYFLKKNNIHKIDLMKINIEGGEYDLLEYLISERIIKNIINIQVQFHNFVVDAEKRMIAIQKNLLKTHQLTYQYKFVWENWLKK